MLCQWCSSALWGRRPTCVSTLESCQFLSRTPLHPVPRPPGAECELNGNKSSMRGWGEWVSRELGKGKLPSQPCSRTVPVSNVLLSQSSPTPHPCCPPLATSCQCFTSVSLPAPHGPRELSPWLLCNSWTGSQDLADILAPPQWHPWGQKVIGVEESASAVLSCLISFTAVLIPMASVCPTAQNSCKAMHIVYVTRWHLTLSVPGPRSFSAE